MSKNKNIKIVEVEIEKLKPAVYNPRRLTEEQEKHLTQSLKSFGLVDPIIVNSHEGRENIVVGGHQRLKIAKKLNYKKIPVVYVDLNEAREKELNLRLNRNLGEWDPELLKNFDLNLLLSVGFNDIDLGNIWNDVLQIDNDDFDEAQELEKAKDTKIKLGDLYQLGNHFLLCSDSSDPKNIKRLMGQERTSMIYCDPNYNISLSYDKGLGGKASYGGNTNDHRTDIEYKEFVRKTIANALMVSNKDAHVFYYCDQRYIGLIQDLYKELGVKNQRVCLWVKNGFNATPQVAFNKCYEPCVYGVKGQPFLSPINNLTEILNKEIATGNRAIDDIGDIIDIWLAKRLPGQDYEHATSKPPTLHEKPLRRCTKINDAVLDLFGGSGSTLIACEQLKRRAFLSEIEPVFCQLICNRFLNLTGIKPKLLK